MLFPSLNQLTQRCFDMFVCVCVCVCVLSRISPIRLFVMVWTDRGAWWVTVHGVERVGHNLATKPPPPQPYNLV